MTTTTVTASFEEIVDRHAPWLIGWLSRRTPSRADAEDLAQETFLLLHANRDRLRKPESLAAYLLGVARNLLRNQRRKTGVRERATPELLARADARAREDADAVDRRDDLAALDEAVSSLPDELEVVVQTYYARQLTYEEAAAILGVPRATVQSRLRRALTLLRERLDEGQTGSVPKEASHGQPR